MAYRLYVGNYPFEFSKDDVQNLFCEFDGVKVEKICQYKEKSKSFAFLVCDDIDQVVSVIRKLNKTKVSGRDLIVRASDDSLQEYVELILQNDIPTSRERPFVPVQAIEKKFRQPHRKSNCEKLYIRNNSEVDMQKNFFENNTKVPVNEGTCSSRSAHNIYQQKHDVNDFETSANNYSTSSETANKPKNYTNIKSNNELRRNNTSISEKPLNSYQTGIDKNEHEYFETSSNYSSRSSKKSYCQSFENILPEKHYQTHHDQFNTSFNNFSGYSHTNETDTQISVNENRGHSYEQHDTSLHTWVSVTNFRIGTYVKTLYELFSDYKPLRVKMICSAPQRNRPFTEAHVCFPNREIAEDVIMNFDNTMFQGRIILVNDVEDLTVMNELLNISHS